MRSLSPENSPESHCQTCGAVSTKEHCFACETKLNVLDFIPQLRWFKCRKCGTETQGTECDGCTRQAPERRLQDAERAVEDHFNYSLPRRFKKWARFDNPKFTELLQAETPKPWLSEVMRRCQSFASDAQVIFMGTTGMGKTSLAVAVAQQWEKTHGQKALFVPAHRLTSGGFDLDPKLVTAPLVILDDLGSEGDIKSSLVPKLIDERFNFDVPLWVTTWLPLESSSPKEDSLKGRYGEGRVRRLFRNSTPIMCGPVLKVVAR